MNVPEENDFKRYVVIARRHGCYEPMPNSGGPNCLGAPPADDPTKLKAVKVGWYFFYWSARLAGNNINLIAPELDVSIYDRWRKKVIFRFPGRRWGQ